MRAHDNVTMNWLNVRLRLRRVSKRDGGARGFATTRRYNRMIIIKHDINAINLLSSRNECTIVSQLAS